MPFEAREIESGKIQYRFADLDDSLVVQPVFFSVVVCRDSIRDTTVRAVLPIAYQSEVMPYARMHKFADEDLAAVTEDLAKRRQEGDLSHQVHTNGGKSIAVFTKPADSSHELVGTNIPLPEGVPGYKVIPPANGSGDYSVWVARPNIAVTMDFTHIAQRNNYFVEEIPPGDKLSSVGMSSAAKRILTDLKSRKPELSGTYKTVVPVTDKPSLPKLQRLGDDVPEIFADLLAEGQEPVVLDEIGVGNLEPSDTEFGTWKEKQISHQLHLAVGERVGDPDEELITPETHPERFRHLEGGIPQLVKELSEEYLEETGRGTHPRSGEPHLATGEKLPTGVPRDSNEGGPDRLMISPSRDDSSIYDLLFRDIKEDPNSNDGELFVSNDELIGLIPKKKGPGSSGGSTPAA